MFLAPNMGLCNNTLNTYFLLLIDKEMAGLDTLAFKTIFSVESLTHD